MIRVVVVVAAMLFSSPAQAIPCWVVRKAVAQYGETRSKGFSDKEIEKARRCLK
jgi:hypothetical protein